MNTETCKTALAASPDYSVSTISTYAASSNIADYAYVSKSMTAVFSQTSSVADEAYIEFSDSSDGLGQTLTSKYNIVPSISTIAANQYPCRIYTVVLGATVNVPANCTYTVEIPIEVYGSFSLWHNGSSSSACPGFIIKTGALFLGSDLSSIDKQIEINNRTDTTDESLIFETLVTYACGNSTASSYVNFTRIGTNALYSYDLTGTGYYSVTFNNTTSATQDMTAYFGCYLFMSSGGVSSKRGTIYLDGSDSFMKLTAPKGANTPVEKPAISGEHSAVYNGAEQSFALTDISEGIIVEGDYHAATNAIVGKDVGTYTATTTLTEGYVWSDESEEPYTLTATITKRPLAVSYGGTQQWDVFTDGTISVSTNVLSGDTVSLKFFYTDSAGTETEVPSSAVRVSGGTYTITLSGLAPDTYKLRTELDGDGASNNNYQLDTSERQFTVTLKTVDISSVQWVYTQNGEQTSVSDRSLTVPYTGNEYKLSVLTDNLAAQGVKIDDTYNENAFINGYKNISGTEIMSFAVTAAVRIVPLDGYQFSGEQYKEFTISFQIVPDPDNLDPDNPDPDNPDPDNPDPDNPSGGSGSGSGSETDPDNPNPDNPSGGSGSGSGSETDPDNPDSDNPSGGSGSGSGSETDPDNPDSDNPSGGSGSGSGSETDPDNPDPDNPSGGSGSGSGSETDPNNPDPDNPSGGSGSGSGGETDPDNPDSDNPDGSGNGNVPDADGGIFKPTLAEEVSFTGEAISVLDLLNGYNEKYMSISGDLSVTEAGHYSVTISLKDPESTHWKEGATESTVKLLAFIVSLSEYDTADITLEWDIVPCVIPVSSWTAVAGEVPKLEGIPESILACLNFTYTAEDGTEVDPAALEVGTNYIVTATVKDEFIGSVYFENEAGEQGITSSYDFTFEKAPAWTDFFTQEFMGLAVWIWLLIALAVLLFLIFLIVLISRRRKKKAEKAAKQTEAEKQEEERKEKLRREEERQDRAGSYGMPMMGGVVPVGVQQPSQPIVVNSNSDQLNDIKQELRDLRQDMKNQPAQSVQPVASGSTEQLSELKHDLKQELRDLREDLKSQPQPAQPAVAAQPVQPIAQPVTGQPAAAPQPIVVQGQPAAAPQPIVVAAPPAQTVVGQPASQTKDDSREESRHQANVERLLETIAISREEDRLRIAREEQERNDRMQKIEARHKEHIEATEYHHVPFDGTFRDPSADRFRELEGKLHTMEEMMWMMRFGGAQPVQQPQLTSAKDETIQELKNELREVKERQEADARREMEEKLKDMERRLEDERRRNDEERRLREMEERMNMRYGYYPPQPPTFVVQPEPAAPKTAGEKEQPVVVVRQPATHTANHPPVQPGSVMTTTTTTTIDATKDAKADDLPDYSRFTSRRRN